MMFLTQKSIFSSLDLSSIEAIVTSAGFKASALYGCFSCAYIFSILGIFHSENFIKTRSIQLYKNIQNYTMIWERENSYIPCTVASNAPLLCAT